MVTDTPAPMSVERSFAIAPPVRNSALALPVTLTEGFWPAMTDSARLRCERACASAWATSAPSRMSDCICCRSGSTDSVAVMPMLGGSGSPTRRRMRTSTWRSADIVCSSDRSACCRLFCACTSSLARPRSALVMISSASTRQAILRTYCV